MSVDMYSGRYGNYFFFWISAMAGILVIVEVSKVLDDSIKPLAFIGKNSLFYYGAHLLVLEWVRALVQMICASQDEYVKTVIYLLAALLFAALLSFLVPLYKTITGYAVNITDRLFLTQNKY